MSSKKGQNAGKKSNNVTKTARTKTGSASYTRYAKVNRGRNKKRKRSVLVPFLITFVTVISVGLIGILGYSVIRNRVADPKSISDVTTKDAGEKYSHFRVQVEAIPEGDAMARQKQHDAEMDAIKEEKVEQIIAENARYADVLANPEYMAEHNIYAMEANEADKVIINFSGDILFDSNYAVMASVKSAGGALVNGISQDVLNYMKNADICMTNNEFPYSTRGVPTAEKQFTFRANPETVNYLVNDMGVDIVSLANNHAYDYGEDALLDTFDTLEKAGVLYVGAGRNKEQARQTTYLIVNDMKIAFLSATQIERNDYPDTKEATDTNAGVFRCWNNKAFLEKIAQAKAESDFVIVYIHWGTENSATTDWAQDQQAPQMVDAGADLIIGDHPHCLQKIDAKAGVPIVYSLGNFWFNSKPVDTGMVQATITKDGLQSLQFIPCMQYNCKTTLATGEDKNRILNYLQSLSGGVQIDGDGYIFYE